MTVDASFPNEERADASSVSHPPKAKWLGFAFVMLGSLALRAVVLIMTAPMVGGDSYEYLKLARLISQGYLAGDQGMRTPGYSLFIVAHFNNIDAVRLTQFILGLCVTAAIYWIVWHMTTSVALATIGAAVYGFGVGQIYLESIIWSEALATAVLTSALVVLMATRRGDAHTTLKLLALGVLLGALPLVRPVYAYMPFLFALPVLASIRSRKRQFWAYFLPAVLPMALWAAYLGYTFNYLGLQTSSGFGWTNHAGAFMRDAPERYKTVSEIYLRQAAAQGYWVNAIWQAEPEMEKATGQTWPELSKTMQSLSLTLLMEHPLGYGQQVTTAFIHFWKGLSFDRASKVLGVLTFPAWIATRFVWLVVAAWFCLVAILAGVAKLRLLRLPPLPWPCGWLIVAVLAAALVQAAVEYGSADRFGMPTVPYTITVAIVAFDRWIWPYASRKLGPSARFNRASS